MPRIIWSGPAVADLSNIRQWLIDEADKPTALRMLRKIRAQSIQLATFPSVGTLLDQSQRKLRVRGTPYVLLYDLDHGEVSILRVRHAHEDWRPPE